MKEQYVIAGTGTCRPASSRPRSDEAHIFCTSGMILRPDFYATDNSERSALRKELGLRPDLTTAIVLFGGHGSKVMYDIASRLDAANAPLQLILICGRNEELAAKFAAHPWRMPVKVIGFTKEIHKLMRAADFLIGKPGPGSIAEAMVRKLPVLIECNSWTLPQERYNAEWVRKSGWALCCAISVKSSAVCSACSIQLPSRNSAKTSAASRIGPSLKFQKSSKSFCENPRMPKRLDRANCVAISSLTLSS